MPSNEIVYPYAGTSGIRQWAQELSGNAQGELEKAQSIFEVLDDVQAVAHQLFQGAGLSTARVATRLHPDFAWGRVAIVRTQPDGDGGGRLQ